MSHQELLPPGLAVRRAVIALKLEALNSCPHNSSVIAATLRIDTPRTYLFASAATSAFPLR